MAKLASMSDTQLIKDKLDIVDLLGEYIQLKPAGTNHKGLCPFHGEKTPSFMVSRERQNWHCFGCSKGGDIFSFIQEIEGMEFIEALKFLAHKAGVELETSHTAQLQQSQKNRLKEINKEAARFYYHFLMKMPIGEEARGYVKMRGMTQETVDEWMVGYSPDQWDLLTKYLLKKGYSVDDLVASGLTIRRENASTHTGQGFYDRFRDRIMFPIRDIHGTVVGFTGRLLHDTPNAGKYVNSPQTQIYDKSNIIFGLDKAKQDIRKCKYVVLVEGQMDVISTHQAGMRQVVATSGTALTEQQISLIKRFTDEVRVSFDADEAGIAAAKRGIDLALEAGLSVKVISVPNGKDPDECVKTNKEDWFNAVESAQNVMEWYFVRLLSGVNMNDPRQKQQASEQLLAEIAHIPSAVERDHWIQQLAERIQVDASVLREDMKRVQTQAKKSPIQIKKQEPAKIVHKETRLHALLEHLMALLLKFPDVFPSITTDRLLDSALSTSAFAPLYDGLKRQYTEKRAFNSEELKEIAPESAKITDMLFMKAELFFAGIADKEKKQEIQRIVALVRDEWKKIQRKHIGDQMMLAEREKNTEKLQQLLEEFRLLQE